MALLMNASRAAACAPELSDDGLGGISVDTPFDRDAVAAALPGCTVDRGAGTSEGSAIDILAITDDATPVALVYPDWSGGIFSVVVQGPGVRNLLGPALGTRFAAVYGDTAPAVCVPGVEESAGRVLCPSGPEARVVYVFEGTSIGPDGSVPAAEVLADWRLAAFLWRPIRFEDPRWVDVAGFDPGEGPALAARVRAAVGDPPGLARLVLYPITLRVTADARERAVEIADADRFVTEYGRHLTPGFVAAVRDEPADRVQIDDNGAALASGRIWIAPVCIDDSCVTHRSGVIAVSMF